MSLDLSAVTTAIFAHVRDGVAALPRNVAVVFDGTRAALPTDRPWCRVTVRGLPTATRTLGAVGDRLAERRAQVVVQVFYPLDDGDGPGHALELAEQIRPLVEGADLETSDGSIHFTGADVRPIGVDGAWYQTNVDARLTYHQTI